MKPAYHKFTSASTKVQTGSFYLLTIETALYDCTYVHTQVCH